MGIPKEAVDAIANIIEKGNMAEVVIQSRGEIVVREIVKAVKIKVLRDSGE